MQDLEQVEGDAEQEEEEEAAGIILKTESIKLWKQVRLGKVFLVKVFQNMKYCADLRIWLAGLKILN